MFGLMQRAVAMEALLCVAEELKRLRPVFKAVLSQAVRGRAPPLFPFASERVKCLAPFIFVVLSSQLSD